MPGEHPRPSPRPASRRRPFLPALTLGCGLWAAFSPAPAAAQDTWTNPFPGVRRLYRKTSTPLRVHLLEVDLCRPGVAIQATKSGQRGRTTSSFGSLIGAEAAVNGDFFSFGSYEPSGLAMGDGAVWPGSTDNSSEGFVAFGPALAMLSKPTSVVPPPAGADNIVAGRPQVVVAGTVPASFNCSSHYCTNNPRTGAGLSEDRRTLYLMVVDGRSSSSAGVTMKGLGQLFKSVGAHDAISFDGGGSSAMWLRTSGIVNTPSDGAQRAVANHLAVHATGVGAAESCVESVTEELLAMAHELDGLGTSDVDGDGAADFCARAGLGFRCTASGGGFGPAANIAALSDAQGFNDSSRYSTIRVDDVDNDGFADVCARTAAGIRCWRSTGTGFGPAVEGPALSDAMGWTALKYTSTIRLADIDADGDKDLCARSAEGFFCWRWDGDGFEGAPIAGPALSDATGWDGVSHYGSLRMGDINGDGRMDLCGRAGAGMRCWPSTGNGFGAAVQGPAWNNDNGWSALRYWSSIRLADIDGDGRADLCARAATGIRCHLSLGTSFGPAIVGPGLSDSSGWKDQANYLTLRMADLDGDGRADVCARADAGLRCWLSKGDGFDTTAINLNALSDANGWYAHRYFRTLRIADVDGDGRADACARGSTGFRCWPFTGASFGAAINGPAWSDANGWGQPRFYTTIRVAGPWVPPPAPTDPAAGSGGGTTSGMTGEPPVGSSGSGSHDMGGAGGSDMGELGGDPLDPGAGVPGEEIPVGCACRTAPARGGSEPTAWLALVAAGWLSRRRWRTAS